MYSEDHLYNLRKTYQVLYCCLGYMVTFSLLYLYLLMTHKIEFMPEKGSGLHFCILIIISYLAFISYSYLFYKLKYYLLKKMGVGTRSLHQIFSNRIHHFNLKQLLNHYPERKIRIIDMVGRRFSVLVFLLMGMYTLYVSSKHHVPTWSKAIEKSAFDMLILWGMFSLYFSNGRLAQWLFGASTRILDGVFGRINLLCVFTLIQFSNVMMIPFWSQLGKLFPPQSFAIIYGMIWSFPLADSAAEIGGSLLGKPTIQVWGLGEINRKSWAGVISAFVVSFLFCEILVIHWHFSWVFSSLALLISFSNAFFELYSPRGSDDAIVPLINLLICLGFGYLCST